MTDLSRHFEGWTPGPEFRVDPREHLGMVAWCLKRYARNVRCLPPSEVLQIAYTTLLTCAIRCDAPETFAAYLKRSIGGEFKTAVRRMRRVTKPGFSQPSAVYLYCQSVTRAGGHLTTDMLRAEFPFLARRGDADIARVIDWCVESDRSAETRNHDDQGATLAERTPAPFVDPADALDDETWTATAESLIDRFDGRQRIIFERRIIGDRDDPANALRVIGKELGVTRARVHQIEVKMRRVMREAIAEHEVELLLQLRPSQRSRVLARLAA